MTNMTRSPVTPLLILGVAGGIAIAVHGCIVPDDRYCTQSAQCRTRDPSHPICDPVNHFCVAPGDGGTGCSSNDDCNEPDRARCDTQKYVCAPCTIASMNPDGTNPDCAGLKPADARSPSLPYCVSQGTATTCVECMTDKDCKRIAAPICNTTTHMCRPCRAHKECARDVLCDNGTRCGGQSGSLVCISQADVDSRADLVSLAGACASDGVSGQVVYVHGPKGVVLCDDAGAGTSYDHPRCSVQAGVNQANINHWPYVRVVGAGYSESVLVNATPGGTIILVGAETPAGDPMAGMQNQMAGAPVFDVTGTGTKVILDEFSVVQMQANRTAVHCKDGSLAIRGSHILGTTDPASPADMPGVLLEDCDATLDGNYIGVTQGGAMMAHGIGVQIVNPVSDHRYVIENNVIAGNMGKALDMHQADAAILQFRFNTVYGNGQSKTAGTFGGIFCPVAGKTFQDSIIASNTQQGGSQFMGSCAFVQVVVGKAEPAGPEKLNSIDPMLDATFHLKAEVRGTPNDCCIDKIAPIAGLPDHDIDRRSRPQNVKWDIGAHEVPAP